MKGFAVFCFFLIPLALPSVCDAEGLSLGLGYPYLSTKCDFKALAVEGKYVNGLGVQAYTGRGYWNYYRSDNLKGFTGLEGGYIKFDTLDTKGTGNEIALFAGGEYFIAKHVSLLMDFAPTLISLKSGNTDAGSLEYVVNIGLYYHFGALQPEAKEPKVFNERIGMNNHDGKSDKVAVLPIAPSVTSAPQSAISPEVNAWLAQLKSLDWQGRRNAAFELGKVKAVEGVESLLELLDDENEKVCGVAALALGRVGDKRALRPLIERLEDESAYVRASAAKGLGYLGDKRAVRALQSALKDDVAQVSKAAEEALGKLDLLP